MTVSVTLVTWHPWQWYNPLYVQLCSDQEGSAQENWKPVQTGHDNQSSFRNFHSTGRTSLRHNNGTVFHPVGNLLSDLLLAFQLWALMGHLTWSNVVCFQTLEPNDRPKTEKHDTVCSLWQGLSIGCSLCLANSLSSSFTYLPSRPKQHGSYTASSRKSSQIRILAQVPFCFFSSLSSFIVLVIIVIK